MTYVAEDFYLLQSLQRLYHGDSLPPEESSSTARTDPSLPAQEVSPGAGSGLLASPGSGLPTLRPLLSMYVLRIVFILGGSFWAIPLAVLGCGPWVVAAAVSPCHGAEGWGHRGGREWEILFGWV